MAEEQQGLIAAPVESVVAANVAITSVLAEPSSTAQIAAAVAQDNIQKAAEAVRGVVPVSTSPAPVARVTPAPIGARSVATATAGRGPVETTVATTQATSQLSLTAKVNLAQGAAQKRPKSLVTFNTRTLDQGYFHAIVYSETDARKTSTAASFETPEWTRIILTRRPEQMLPLRDLGYDVAYVGDDSEALTYALTYPEQVWPEWAALPDPQRRKTLILDDVTKAVELLLEANSFIDGKEVKDPRRSYNAAKGDMNEILKSILRKPYNFIMVALAKVQSNPLSNEEQIMPDLPPSMSGLVTTEFEYCLYIQKSNWKMLTTNKTFAYKDVDEYGKEKVFLRRIFSKHKIPLSLTGKGVVKDEEELNLNALWKRVQAAKAQANTAAFIPPVAGAGVKK